MTSKADPMAGIAAVINQINQQKEIAINENKHIKQLVSIQDQLVSKQRSLLIEVTKTSQELKAVEEKRTALKNQLSSQKSKLLVAASESSDLINLIEQTVTVDQNSMSGGLSGQSALKAIEDIQKCVFSLTEACLKEDGLAVPADQMSEVVLAVNDVIQGVISSGAAKESTEDTVRRQSFVISTLVPAPPAEEQ